jgi:hypothetical protein
MTWDLITTPNGKEYKAKANSWHLLHIHQRWQKSYADLNPESYTASNGKIRYRVKLPALLSVASTDDNEVLMDLYDACKCYCVPAGTSFYLDAQLFLNGEEVPHPYSRAKLVNPDQYVVLKDSWFLLHIKKEYVDEYEDLDPEEYFLSDGRVRYKAALPMLGKTLDGDNYERILKIEEACKYFNVPRFNYESFEMFVDGNLAEHPANEISTSIRRLPSGEYYVGEPLYPKNGDERTYDKLFEHKGTDRTYTLQNHKIVTVSTGGDDSYRLYKSTSSSISHIDSIITETATVCFAPLALLYDMGYKLPKIKREGFTFDSRSSSSGSDKKTFSVVITYKGGRPQHISFLDYTILVDDRYRFED